MILFPRTSLSRLRNVHITGIEPEIRQLEEAAAKVKTTISSKGNHALIFKMGRETSYSYFQYRQIPHFKTSIGPSSRRQLWCLSFSFWSNSAVLMRCLHMLSTWQKPSDSQQSPTFQPYPLLPFELLEASLAC